MRVCLVCRKEFGVSGWRCPFCGAEPAEKEGFPSFAPELAEANASYREGHFEKIVKVEARCFWFRVRNRLISETIGRYIPEMKSFLEIGCGTGLVLSEIGKTFPHVCLCGSDVYSTALQYARRQVPRAELFQMNAIVIPFSEEFDAVGLFDVLEHIEEDEVVLRQVHRALRKDGMIFLTVPHHPFLWSGYDVLSCHVRRYTIRELRAKAERAGFGVVRMTAFMAPVLPLMAASRMRTWKGRDCADEMGLPGWMNSLFEKILSVERAIIRAGFDFPFGGSLLLVGRKG